MGQDTSRSESLGEMIRRNREEKGLAPDQVVARAQLAGHTTGLSVDTIGRIEKGQTAKPGKETLRAIAAGIGVDEDEFRRWRAARDAIHDKRSRPKPVTTSVSSQAAGITIIGPEISQTTHVTTGDLQGTTISARVQAGGTTPVRHVWSRRTPGAISLVIGLVMCLLGGSIFVLWRLHTSWTMHTPRAAPATEYLQPYLHGHRCGAVPTHIGTSYFLPARYNSFCNVIEWDFPDASAYTTCSFYGESPAVIQGGRRYAGTTDPQYGVFEHRLKVATIPVAHTPTNVWQLLTTINPATIYVQVYDNNWSRSGTIGLGRIKAVCL